jgi:hypothetical protein
MEAVMSFFDVDPAHNSMFPRHGWITGVTGVKLLRLPILRLYQMGEPTYQRFELHNIAGVWLQFRSPYRTLRQLAIGLRDLHKEISVQTLLLEVDWMRKEPSVERDTAVTRMREGNESIEVSLLAIFVLLRRLADELINASAPFLFEHSMSAPRKMSVAIAKAKEGGLNRWKPLCNLDVLTDALLNHTGWLVQLREHGIRDILIHDPHVLTVGGLGSGSPEKSDMSWQVVANLMTANSTGMQTTELLSALRECISGACSFMELLYASVEPSKKYARGDYIFLTGSDDDVTGFWPPILDGRGTT